MNPNFRDYKILTAKDDDPGGSGRRGTGDADGPYGAKGIGEPGLVPTAPAIANAIYDAIGVRISELPITPERIRQEPSRPRKGMRGVNKNVLRFYEKRLCHSSKSCR